MAFDLLTYKKVAFIGQNGYKTPPYRVDDESGEGSVLKLNSYAVSDVGRKRGHNEDSYILNEDMKLFVVADGMGGHSGGEFASKLAVKTVEEVVQAMSEDPEATSIAGLSGDIGECGLRLKHAIQVASEKIFDQAIYDSTLRGMGTTTVALLFDEEAVYVANVGDSRAYLFRGGRLEQMTEDHSLVGEQLRAGLINKKDVKNHKFKNVITRSVGFQEHVEIDLAERPLKVGDRFLLCTDGLTNAVQDAEIKEIISKNSVQDAAHKLVDLANARGGDDNVTLILVDIAAL